MAQNVDPQEFDPYWEWLKIPPEQQPPNHYLLLGLNVFEADSKCIEAAVSQLVEKMHRLAHGPRVESTQKILNQVAQARICFNDPKKKEVYDCQLRAKLLNPAPAKELRQQGDGAAKVATPRFQATPTKEALAAKKAGNAKQSKTRDASKVKLESDAKKVQRLKIATGAMLLLGALVGFTFVWLVSRGRPATLPTSTIADQTPAAPEVNQQEKQRAPSTSTVTQISNKTAEPATTSTPQSPQTTPKSVDSFSETAKTAAVNLGINSHEATTAPPPKPAVTNPTATSPAATKPETPAAAVNTVVTPAATPTDTPPSPPPSVPENNPGLKPIPEQPGTYAPVKPADFAGLLNEVVGLQGAVVATRTSSTGKTVYLMFAANKNDLIEVRGKAADIKLADLAGLVGKTVRVRGVLKEEFGSKTIGLEIDTFNQIEIIP